MDHKISVKFFKTDSGAEPVRDWLKNYLTKEERIIIGRDILKVQLSWPTGPPLVKKIDRGLWEIRSSLRNKEARVFFTIYKGEIILLHSFIKKDQKTSVRDLDLAKKNRDDFK